MSIDTLLRRLHELTPLVRSEAETADRTTTLSERVIAAVRELGLFKLWVPERHGGRELDLPKTLRVYEAAAKIDGSLGWAVMIGAGGGLFGAYLEPDAAHRLFAAPDALVAGSGAPSGRAERLGNGYRVSGRWKYASGARHATVFTANCIVTKGGIPVQGADEKPLIRAMSFAPNDVTIIPTWNATGMRGTGSHDFEVQEVFVPESHTFNVFADMPRESGTLYRLPFDVLTYLPIAAVACGIARHALDEFAALAALKPFHSDAVLASDPNVHSRYAECHARWTSTHLALHAMAERVWRTVTENQEVSAIVRSEVAAGTAFFITELEAVVAQLLRIAGMNGVLHDQPLARASRDLQTLAAHVATSPLALADAGRTLLGAGDSHEARICVLE